MNKIRKFMMGFVFALIVVMGVNAGSSDVKAATTKNFKGNLNVTYKNSEWKSKITIKKVNSKKVKINVKSSGIDGNFTGKVISKNTIKMNTGSKYAKVNFKWIDKTHFKTIWKENGENIDGFISNYSLILYNNTKYTQVKKTNTVYYGASHTKEKDEYGLGAVSKMTLKGKKLKVKGSLVKATSKKNLYKENKRTLLKKATRTFKLDKNFKAYGCGGESPDEKLSKKLFKDYLKNPNGLYLEFIVKNGKLTRLNFCS